MGGAAHSAETSGSLPFWLLRIQAAHPDCFEGMGPDEYGHLALATLVQSIPVYIAWMVPVVPRAGQSRHRTTARFSFVLRVLAILQ